MYSNKGGVKIKVMALLLISCLMGLGVSFYFRHNVTPVILSVSESTIRYQATNAVNSAAHMVIEEALDYKEFVTLIYDAENNIRLIQPNTVKINRLARDLANMSQKNIDTIGEQFVEIPLGAFSGSIILSGMGPQVAIKTLPIGSVLCDYSSVFENVGINQTRHSIYINVHATISIVLPIYSLPIDTTISVMVCENVIMGSIPDVFVSDSNGGTQFLDLIP